MNYHVTVDGDPASIASLFHEIEVKGASLFKNSDSDVSHNFLIKKKKTGKNRVSIELTTFTEITSYLINSLRKLSEKFENPTFKIQYIEEKKEIVGGYQIQNGKILASFMYEDTCVMCDVIEDYLCSLHLMNRYRTSISTDGVLLSELVSIDEFKIGNINYFQEKRIIHFFDGEKLCFNIEYNDCQDSNDMVEQGCQTFGLSDFSWSSNDSKTEETEGVLYDLIQGNILKNFFHIVGFRFASEVAIDIGMHGLGLVV